MALEATEPASCFSPSSPAWKPLRCTSCNRGSAEQVSGARRCALASTSQTRGDRV